MFNVGDSFQTHTEIINDDYICKNEPSELFYSTVGVNGGMQQIFVIRLQAIITIDDLGEQECC